MSTYDKALAYSRRPEVALVSIDTEAGLAQRWVALARAGDGKKVLVKSILATFEPAEGIAPDTLEAFRTMSKGE